MKGYDHMSQVAASHNEIRDGEVIIVFSNGEKLSEAEAQKLNQGIAEQLTMGQMARDAMAHAGRQVEHAREELAIDPEDEIPPPA